MSEAQEPKFSPAPTLSSTPALRLAVFHRSADVSWHTAPLCQVEGLELVVAWQGTSWTIPQGVSGLLWEFAPQDATDPRLAALIDRIPSASYSASAAPGLAELSKTFGFRRHLTTPAASRGRGARARACRPWSIWPIGSRPPRCVWSRCRIGPKSTSEVLRAVNAAERSGGRVGRAHAARRRVAADDVVDRAGGRTRRARPPPGRPRHGRRRSAVRPMRSRNSSCRAARPRCARRVT